MQSVIDNIKYLIITTHEYHPKNLVDRLKTSQHIR